MGPVAQWKSAVLCFLAYDGGEGLIPSWFIQPVALHRCSIAVLMADSACIFAATVAFLRSVSVTSLNYRKNNPKIDRSYASFFLFQFCDMQPLLFFLSVFFSILFPL